MESEQQVQNQTERTNDNDGSVVSPRRWSSISDINMADSLEINATEDDLTAVQAAGAFVRAPLSTNANDVSILDMENPPPQATIEDTDDTLVTLIESNATHNVFGESPIQRRDWKGTGAVPKQNRRVVVDRSLGDVGVQYALPLLGSKSANHPGIREKNVRMRPTASNTESNVVAAAASTPASNTESNAAAVNASGEQPRADANIVYDKRTMYVDGLVRMRDNLLANEAAVPSKHTIALQIENANKYWDKFLECHNEVYAAANTPLAHQQASRKHLEVELLHSELLAGLHQRLEECNNAHPMQWAGDHGRPNDVKLQPVKIDPFDGDFEKWPAFKSVFTNYFAQGYTKSAKMIYLRQSLVVDSEAFNLIAGLEPTGDNFDFAWTTLCDTYDDVRRILEKAFCSLLDVQAVPTPATRASLLNLVTRTKNTMEAMTKYGVETATWGPALVPIVARKLDPASHSDWCLSRPRKEVPRIEPLLHFITIRSEGIEEYNRAASRNAANNNYRGNLNSNSSSGYSRNSQNHRSNPFTRDNGGQASSNNAASSGASGNANANVNASQPGQGKRRCPDPLCAPNNKHHLFSCPRFKSLDIERRKSKASVLGVCECCLSKGCRPATCKLSGCTVCNEKHNSWLCTVSPRAAVMQSVAVPVSNCIANCEEAMDDSPESTLLATAVIVINDKLGNAIQFRALCDPGSQVNLMTSSAYHRLRFGRTMQPVELAGIDEQKSIGLGKVNVKFGSRFPSTNTYHMTAIIMKKITGRLPSSTIDTTDYRHVDGLSLADPNYNVSSDIDVLLGAAVCSELLISGMKHGGIGQPVAQCTRIGWILYGSTEVSQQKLAVLHAIAETPQSVADAKIDELLQRLWEVEAVPQKHLRTKEEQLCEDHFVANTVRNESGRYVVKLPILDDAVQLGNSRQTALCRLMQLEKRFVRTPALKENYVQFMREYLSLGHMREAGPLPHGQPHYYIPHHAAGTKKFRVVFDGSAKTSNDKSLNDIQLTGEKLQSAITATTMRFRTHKVALTADIKKMYRQVLVAEKQFDYQRILWREDSKLPIKEYQLVTQTYGLRSAPHNCIRALIQCANDYQQEHPAAADVTKRDFYVDDLLTGAHTVDDAVKLHKDLNEMLLKGGFELAKWATNSTFMHAQVGDVGPTKPVKVDTTDEGEMSVLGLRWSPREDAFRYKVTVPEPCEKVTKRRIVSHSAKLYDPNGYLSPVTVVPKIIIQQVWIAGSTWDAKVDDNIVRDWKKFAADLLQLEKVRIPRWLGTGGNAYVELHAFCDASNDAYACAFYIKTIDEQRTIRANLVMSRTRVAPLKRSTTPRLELCGAHLLAKSLAEVQATHGVQTQNIHLWTDSMIVLHWLNKEPARTKVYVANRVAETIEFTKGCVWRHVPTNDNPADLASRGISSAEIVNNDLWWHGPQWMTQQQSEWPNAEVSLTAANKEAMAAEEHKPAVALATVIKEPFLANETGDLLKYCSSAHRLYRITAWVLRFTRNCRRTAGERVKGVISADEYLAAESYWIRDAQQRHFSIEIDCCKKRVSTLPKKSKLIGMRPFIDGEGILRCNGRLENAHIPYDASHPIILSSECLLAKLIIRSAHHATLHGGSQDTMQYVRNKFWIPRLRVIVKSVIHHCPKCIRFTAQPMHQLMGWLPEARVTPGRPFKESGVDYCGPFAIKARGGRCNIVVKGYVAVFVCMKTRAVHLEVVSDMTSEAFLAALTRMSSRRGRVHDLYSDNGTNFHGAEKELIATVKAWKKLSTDDLFQQTLTKWHFIPPGSPHHGGLWESAVKRAKYHLRRVVGETTLTFEELTTVLTSVEACLNSRPLCRLSDDNTDNRALTPAHFLIGEPIIAPLTRDWTTTPENRLKRWKLLEKFGQDFWKRWREEYLDQLLACSKWKSDQPNASVDDVVILRSDNLPPTQWPLGRIVHVYTGADGLVRSVDVRCGDKTYRRPITKLVPLPTEAMD